MAKVTFLDGNPKRFLRKFTCKSGLLTLFLLLASFPAFAQQATISGRILDERTKAAVLGANIRIKGETGGTSTDENGNFSLKVKSLPATLFVTSIYYKNQELDVYEAVPTTIYLTEDLNRLNSVVVVGYQQTKKNALASATTTIAAEEISKANYTSFVEKLQGQVPGLAVSSNSGVPGTSVLVRLRGATSINASNDPLYIIDGTVINNKQVQGLSLGGQVSDPLSDINSEDIESVSVLKDADATAQYGSRGANGVILITTKRGKSGKSKIQFQAEYGASKNPKTWELVTGPEHGEIVNTCWINDGKTSATRPFRPTSEVISGYAAYGTPEEQQTYDRLSDVFRIGQLQKYNVSVSGGDSKTTFYLGGEYLDQESTLKLQDLKRYSFRINLDHSISNKVKIGTSNSLSNVGREVVRVGDGPAGLFQAALHTPTFYAIYASDGSYNKPVLFDNHQAILDNSDNHAYSIRSINNLYIKWDILKNLTFKSTLNNDYNNYHEKAYYNTNLVYGTSVGGIAYDNITAKHILGAEQLFNFNYNFGDKNDFSAFFGNTVEKTTKEVESLTGSGFPSNEFKRITSASTLTSSSSGTSSSLVSFFGGGNFSYQDRYSFDANIRADASSRFGVDNRWGYFPSVGGAWSVVNESFFPKVKQINDLKIKASWGYTGNQEIGDFASLGLWNGGNNYDGVAGIAPSQLANPDLKWETTRQWNVGIIGSLFNNRLNFDLNYYDKYTYDLLLNDPVAAKTGFSSVLKNIGEMSNRGLEFALNSTNIKKNDFEWKTSFSISHNDNKVEKLNTPITGGYAMYQLQQGYPIYSFYVYHYLGVNPETGDAIYENLDDDDKITVADKKFVGNAWAKFEGSLKNTFTYKSFDLGINLIYKYGNKNYNYTRYFMESGGTRGVTRSILKSSLNYWKNVGDVDVLPRPKSTVNADGGYNYMSNSSLYVEDASYIRLRDITLGYTVPKKMLSKIKISQVRGYITATNLFTITKYTGPDPEVNVGADSGTLVQGLDFGTIAQPVSVSIGLNITI